MQLSLIKKHNAITYLVLLSYIIIRILFIYENFNVNYSCVQLLDCKSIYVHLIEQ